MLEDFSKKFIKAILIYEICDNFAKIERDEHSTLGIRLLEWAL
jgi:hypothetical protein